MFPIVLDLGALKVALVGEGEAVLKRLTLLDDAGAAHVEVYSASPNAALRTRAGSRLKGERPSQAALEAAHLVLLAGLGEAEAETLAGIARKAGRLVNTEDVKALCDFHVPSVVRRGDLLLTVSTGGKSPGLARRLRRHLRCRARGGSEGKGGHHGEIRPRELHPARNPQGGEGQIRLGIAASLRNPRRGVR